MNDEWIEAEEIADELLAEEMDCAVEDAYDRWRDMWCDNLHDDLKEVFNNYINPPKHGYYSGNREKFLEHAISCLESISNCRVRANDGHILATANETVVGDAHEVLNEVKQPV